MTKAICSILICLILPISGYAQQLNRVWVCGDDKILLVDYSKSNDSIPLIIWQWNATQAIDLPDSSKSKLKTIDECKEVDRGKRILISSSSGAIAILAKKSRKIQFYADVDNAHSIELLPGHLLAAAASTGRLGNCIILFDIRFANRPIYFDSLYSAHGLVWHAARKSLFALGGQVLREYKLETKHSVKLTKVNEWKIPGSGGHDLSLSPGNNDLFLTELNGAWIFNLNTYVFKKIPGFDDGKDIKSLVQSESGQFVYTQANGHQWWTNQVRFANPKHSLFIPNLNIYKVRLSSL